MVAVIASTGIRLMPTTEMRARKLLKSGRARIYSHKPMFTIQLLDRENGDVQEVELKCDTGYLHIGMSGCSQKHEYVSIQYDLLKDEVSKHENQRMYRRQRRSRLRYRKPRFDNRKKPEGWLAPSLEHKRDAHIRLIVQYCSVLPVSSIILEMGQFDTQALKAIEEGKPIPQGEGYQHGERYGIATLREATFSRDDHACQICGKGIKDGAILRVHHIGFWRNDHSDRLSNLLTVCDKCHSQKNHQKGGKLWGLKSSKGLHEAAFMNTVKWQIYEMVKTLLPDIKVGITYGAMTKEKRHDLHVAKSHVADAWAMGKFHPKHRCKTLYRAKARRNNRVLEKFYDAKYIDSRDGSTKSGKELFSGRVRRNKSRNTENLHIYRGEKVSKGKKNIRQNCYSIRPGDILIYDGSKFAAKGVHCNGSRVILSNGKSVAISKTTCVYHTGAWQTIG